MRLADLAAASAAVRDASGRKQKVAHLAGALRALDPDEVAAGTAFLSGDLLQRQIGVGWAALREVPPPAAEPSLTVAEVDAAFARIGALTGPGSVAARREALGTLFGRATADEQRLLRGLLSGNLRQGALEGVATDAVAQAAELPLADVRRAAMLRGDLPAVAAIALGEGAPGLAAIGLQVGRPVQPMLAGTAKDVGDALARIGSRPGGSPSLRRPAAVEWKLDGARIQVHRDGHEVGVFTRSLDDVTARVPEIVALARGLPARALVLDGEAIALRGDGRPHPFQVTASRFGSRGRSDVPLTALFFDLLHLDGDDLLDRPGAERAQALQGLVPEAALVPRVVAEDEAVAGAALEAALARGHEGVVVKALDAPYLAGRRGAGWLKVKPVHTLDLVVLAVEHGSGRRQGWLSNLHLGARADEGEGFVMLGKTFKGLTDEMLRWQTAKLRELEVSDDGWVVRVRPELVVEIAFDGVQTSRRYPGGVALRFARVLRHRPDKRAEEADTLAAVLAHRPA
jgi:DNA ligase-1